MFLGYYPRQTMKWALVLDSTFESNGVGRNTFRVKRHFLKSRNNQNVIFNYIIKIIRFRKESLEDQNKANSEATMIFQRWTTEVNSVSPNMIL